MKIEEFIDYMKDSVTCWRASGQYDLLKGQYDGFLITLEGFRNYAKSQDAAEKAKHELLIEFSKGSLRALLLVNTGGVFVVMTLLSAILSRHGKFIVLLPEIAKTAKIFIVGISFAVLTVLFSYLSQYFINDNKETIGKNVNWGAIASGAIAFGMFVYGAFSLQSVFSSCDVIAIIRSFDNATE